MARVYVSSTVADLKQERQAVIDWLVAAGHQPVHSYWPSSESVRDSCLDDIDGCDLYVLILGHRYGALPPKDNPEGLSITHLEFRRAGQLGIPRIALLRTSIPDISLSDMEDPEKAALVFAFREEVAREVRVAEFADLQGLIQGLSTGVPAALEKQSARRRAADRALRLAPRSSPPRILINYRRQDAAPYARLLQNALNERFPRARDFTDWDAIEPGMDFADVIREMVGSSAVLVNLIGPQWLTAADEQGRRRLDDPDDFVRMELQAAFERRVRVVPVLVDGAKLPRPQELPPELQELGRLNAFELSTAQYQYDADQLSDLIQQVLTKAAESEHEAPEHPDTVATRPNIGGWAGAADDAAEARDQFTALLHVIKRVSGPEHPDTLATRANLARWTGRAGDAAGARDQFTRLLPVMQRTLGPEHPDTLIARSDLARWTGAAGNAAGAFDQFAALLPTQVRVLGPENPDTLSTRAALAYWTERIGR
jgi:hypothetical protein